MKQRAFTLAEVLITLTIIGIIAAMVIPSLMADINEKAFDTQRKALYARMTQAIPTMDKIAGYGTLIKDNNNNITDTASETFVTEGLSKVIKMNNICYNDNLSDCNFPESFTTFDGASTVALSSITTLGTLNPKMLTATNSYWNVQYSQLNTKASSFETANGESVLVYYNPNCAVNLNESSVYYTQSKMCVNFIYDLNGTKAPNTVGKDIGFISVLYPTDSFIVSPAPVSTTITQVAQTEASSKCKEQDLESRPPNVVELASMFYNMKLLNIESGEFWSSTPVKTGTYAGTGRTLGFSEGTTAPTKKSDKKNLRCVKK